MHKSRQHHYDIVFTFNFSIVSRLLPLKSTLYFMVYDCPLVALYSCAVINPIAEFFFLIAMPVDIFALEELQCPSFALLCEMPIVYVKNLSMQLFMTSPCQFIYTKPKQRLCDKLSK